MSEKENEVNLNEILKSDQEDSVVKDESIYTEEKSKLSQEAKNIFKALEDYVEKYNGDAFYHVDFGAFDESHEIIDDRFDMYGPDDLIKISLEGMLKFIKQRQETED